MNKEEARQLYKAPNTHLVYSHIMAKKVNSIWQMDLLDVTNYGKQNSGYNWILTLLDVYSRYAMLFPLKKKSEVPTDLSKLLQVTRPENITSDNDTVFKSHETQNILKKYGIKHYFAAKGDHRVLGLIDRFHRTFRRKMILYMASNHTLRWIDALDELIKDYNETPHMTLRKNDSLVSPEQVYLGKVKPRYWYQYNLVKFDNIPNLDDYVRILLELGHFDKRTTTQRWSTEVYQVIGITGGIGSVKYRLKNIQSNQTLEKLYRPFQLQIIPRPLEQKSLKPEIQPQIRAEKKKTKIHHELKREDIQSDNILTSKRQRKYPSHLKEYWA
jgi:Integrase core domain